METSSLENRSRALEIDERWSLMMKRYRRNRQQQGRPNGKWITGDSDDDEEGGGYHISDANASLDGRREREPCG
jgi:hypothetical protein